MEKKYDKMFLEAVVNYAGTDDPTSVEYQDALSIMEGKGNEKRDYLKEMVSDITKWSKSSEKRNQEIYDTKGDITKFDPDIKEVIEAVSGAVTPGGTLSYDGTGGSYEGWRARYIRDLKAMYGHFLLHKKLYTDAFKTGNETAKAVYISGTWLIISYTSTLCSAFMGNTRPTGEGLLARGSKLKAIDMKYGKMVEDLQKVISHPKYTEYLNTAEQSVLNTESILYEGVLAIGSMIVGLVVTLRLIMWNIYTMRTKLSDKLKVSAEFLEKNAKRIGNTDKKNAKKISEKQQLAAIRMNKMAEKLRIKGEEDEFSKPPAPTKTERTTPSTPSNKQDDDDIDIEL